MIDFLFNFFHATQFTHTIKNDAVRFFFYSWSANDYILTIVNIVCGKGEENKSNSA